MNLCSRCHKNPAVIYIAKIEGDKTTNEGLCLACAKQLGIAPLNNMLEQMGIGDEDIDSLNTQMADFAENMDSLAHDGGFEEMISQLSSGVNDEGGAATAPMSFLSKLFSPGEKNQGDAKDNNIKEPKRNKKNGIGYF